MRRLFILLCAFGCAHALAKDELSFTNKIAEINVPPGQDAVVIKFPFKNSSTETVKLGKITSNCDCTEAEYENGKTAIAPSEQGVVKAVIKTGSFSGLVEKELLVNAQGSTYKLVIKAKIPDVISISPKKLEWKNGEEPTPKTITITIQDKLLPLKLTKVSLEGDAFNYEPVTVKPGREYKVVVTPKTTQKAVINSIWILTDSTVPRYSRVLGILAVKSKGKT